MSVNKIILVGNLGADPDMKYTATGTGICEMRVATTEKWNDKGGQKQERTSWHRVIVFGKTAEACAKYLTKGRQVFIDGRVQYREYEKDGQKKYITEIVANDVQFLGGGKGEGRSDAGAPPSDSPAPPAFGDDESIPFGTCAIGAEPSSVARVLRRVP